MLMTAIPLEYWFSCKSLRVMMYVPGKYELGKMEQGVWGINSFINGKYIKFGDKINYKRHHADKDIICVCYALV